MTQLQKGLQREIAAFAEAIEQDGGSIPEVSKAAFCKARKKLKPTVFRELNKTALETFYDSNEVQRWQGWRVLGVDGSTIELPNSQQIQQEYGIFQTRKDGKAICLGRTLLIYDTLNHLTVYGGLGKMTDSETHLFIEATQQQEPEKQDLFVFDRYYASQLMYFYLAQKEAQFCFRLKRNWWKPAKDFYQSGKTSQILTIVLPEEDQQRAQELGILKKSIKVRLVRVELEDGQTELLLTSLTDERRYSNEKIKELYALRWPIEDAYKSLKHKMCLENFSGKSCKAVLQDFYVKIFIMNLTAVAVRPINEALKKQSVKVKYVHQSNFTEALASMKKAVISFFLTRKIMQAINTCITRIKRLTEPLRPGRKSKRNHQPKRKYYMNYKQP
jgi:hypothetical protein